MFVFLFIYYYYFRTVPEIKTRDKSFALPGDGKGKEKEKAKANNLGKIGEISILIRILRFVSVYMGCVEDDIIKKEDAYQLKKMNGYQLEEIFR